MAMKFSELPESAKHIAREALSKAAFSMGSNADVFEYERVGEAIAAAFVKMERYDSAPDVCAD
jgi:TRAP-type mannitol/chloroaromatic compound transport system substrate-binding protein